MRSKRLFLLLALAAVLSAPAIAAGPKTYQMAASDGTKLATDVTLPEGKGPWPVILSRTPYNRRRSNGRFATSGGYAYVVQDMRGRFDSQGKNIPFIGCGWHEHTDGADTVAWLLKQPWCNGKIGTLGASAGGITQNLLAGTAPKGLVSQYIQVAASSLYHDATYIGGAFRYSQVVGWLRSNRFSGDALKLMTEHPAYDEYWHAYDSTRKHSVMTAGAVHVGGWFDTFSQGTIDSFVGRQYGGGVGARGKQKLVMGPWAHGIGRPAGELRFPDIRPPQRYGVKRWFDYTLKGVKNGMMADKAVAYYVMGDANDREAPGNEWRYADRWPVASTPTPYYFHKGGTLDANKSEATDAFKQYTFDPAKPCPTVGGRNLNLPSGPRNQNKIEQRPDVMTFTTAPLTTPVEVTGRIRANIHVSSSAVDTDLSVRFCDVYPDGSSYLMAEGMLRLRCRDSLTNPTPLEPNKVYPVTVDCWSTSVVINKAHRIRVSVTSSNAPRFDVNPGTGKPATKGGKTVKQTNRIYCDATRPSHIILPVVKGQ